MWEENPNRGKTKNCLYIIVLVLFHHVCETLAPGELT